MNYSLLNIKTHYELLNSLIKSDELISYALKNNIKALGVTDSNMFGTIELYNKCRENQIKFIVGIEVIFNEYKFLLYATNYNGYVNLCNIVSIKNTSELTIDILKEKNKDIICVIDSNYYNDFEEFKNIFEVVFLSYKNKEERLNSSILTDNIVFMEEINCLSVDDKKYLPYLYMIKDSKTIDDIKSYEINESLYIPDKIDIESINKFEMLCNLEFPKFSFDIPVYTKDSSLLLKNLCKKGLEKRLDGKVTKEYIDRLFYEIDVIEKMGFVDYFLIVYDFVLYAKKHDVLVGPGRGSGAGSLVCYTLGITEIDPIKYDLIFERFLNPERISMPDIDIDFDYKKRDQVVDYVKEKYGYDKVANIITFGTLLPKAVIRDVGRVLNIEISLINSICKFLKDETSLTLLLGNPKFKVMLNSDDRLKTLMDISIKFEGLKRHSSIHAAGVIISKENLMNKIPLYKSGNNILTGYTMEHLENLGLLKMDFLALSNLSIIDNIIKNIESTTNKKIILTKIPLDDSKTIKLFNEVDTLGIFQFESGGMMNFLRNLKIDNFSEIVDAIALFRPGPMANIDSYIKRKEGREKITYLIPQLEPILKSTKGIIIYQEQIIEILRTIGGYTYAEADNIRRAMSKKKEDVILKEKDIFVTRTVNKGIDKNKAIEIYDLVLRFANYGFNKSHSVAYSYIGYWMAYLKANYKEYFITELLNNVIGSETKIKEYIEEALTMNLTIGGVDINISTDKFIVENNKLYMPLNVIKNIGVTSVNEILEERKKGNFKDFLDFVKRTKLNIRVLENLIKSGSFDNFGINRKTLIESTSIALNYSKLCSTLDESLVMTPEIIETNEYPDDILMSFELELFGFYIKNHPIKKYKRDNLCTSKDIERYFDKVINILLYVERVNTIQTKNKDKMCFLTCSDEYKKVDVVLFPRIYKEHSDIEKNDILKLTGKVEKRMNKYQLVVSRIEKIA